MTSKKVEFTLQSDLALTNPLGSYNATVGTRYIYVGSVGYVSGYDAKNLKPVFRLSVEAISNPGNAMRAVTLLNDTRLLVGVDQSIALYDNTTPTHPTFIHSLSLGATIIDMTPFDPSMSILYVLTQAGLFTLDVSPTSLVILQQESFAADLNAGLLLENRRTALYVSAVTHGALYVFDVTNPRNPSLFQTLIDSLYPVDLTQSCFYPDLLLSGGIFGISFYNVRNPLKIKLINQEPSPYLNLIRFLPNTPYVVNALYLPTNQLVMGKIRYRKRVYHYRKLPGLSLPIQFGRLPWDVALVPEGSKGGRRGKVTNILVTNNTEGHINVARVRIKSKR